MNAGADRDRRDRKRGPPALPPKVTGRKRPVAAVATQPNYWVGIAIGATATLIICLVAGGVFFAFRSAPPSDLADRRPDQESNDTQTSLGTESRAASEGQIVTAEPEDKSPDVVDRFFQHLVASSSGTPAPASQQRQPADVVAQPATPVVTDPPVSNERENETTDSAPVSAPSGSEAATKIRQVDEYVDLPTLPAGPTAAKEEAVLSNVGPAGEHQLRLLGLREFVSELASEAPDDDLQRINVVCDLGSVAAEREVVGRFRIHEGRLKFKWTHQTGRLRSLQEFLRECVIEIRNVDSGTSRYIALRKPTVGKAESIERLLKDDRKLMIGKALSGVAKRRIFLGEVTLEGTGRSYGSVPLRHPTRENRDAVARKDRDRKPAKSQNRRPKDDTDDDSPMDDDELMDESPDPEELEEGHFRQQNFPTAAALARLPKLFVEIFPHADHVILRLDTDPSYVAHFRRVVGARARISSLNKGIRSQQNIAAKAHTNADNYAAAARNANNQGERGNALANAQRALQDAQRAEAQIVQLKSQIPRWEQAGTEAESQCTKIKTALSQLTGAAISGTMYRIVEGVRVDVVRMGDLAPNGSPTADSSEP